MKAIEVAGHVDERHVLHLDEPLALAGPLRVRVLALVPDDEVSEAAWRQAATRQREVAEKLRRLFSLDPEPLARSEAPP